MKRKLKVAYILPSRYDEEGYVLRYWRGILPSNTLSCLRGLTESIAANQELGPDVEVSVEVFDDTVQKVPVAKIARVGRRPDTQLLVGLVGVQSNQFARASDLALEFRALGIPVMIGGFHVSGMLATFGEPTPDLQRLLDAGVTLVRGEVDGPGVMAGILRDALEDRLEPLYNITDPPDLFHAPIPKPDPVYRRRFALSGMCTLDTSRGCPFNCSFCTVINVQGRKMRHRSPECVLKAVEESCKQGGNFFFFTDDNFARNPAWEEILDGLAAMRARGVDLILMMQLDTQSYKIPRLVEKAKAAGCNYVFIGMESVNPDNLKAAGKAQNKVSDFAHMVDVWHQAGILVHCGYIIGFPHDTAESVRRDVALLKDEVKIDEATFFVLTPLPGSRDHRKMVADRVPLDADLNSYDSFHETHRHPRMAPGEWTEVYREAWNSFYSKENMVNVLLRTPKERYWQLFRIFVWYRYCIYAGTHPMVTGFVRLKDRKARRPLFERESVPRYAARRVREMLAEIKTYLKVYLEFQEIWMLTRPEDDPRWATLADLRARWTDVRHRLRELELSGRCEDAVQELRGLLKTASERLTHLSTIRQSVGGGLRRRLSKKVQEVETCLQSLEVSRPDWNTVKNAQRFISDSLVTGYEELAIRYVAQRRRVNHYREEFLARLKSGRVRPRDLSLAPRALLFEVVFGLRFGMSYFSNF